MKKQISLIVLSLGMMHTPVFADALIDAAPAAPPVIDVKRADAAQAIINYQGELAEKERVRALTAAPSVQNVAQTIDALALYKQGASTYSSLLTNLSALSRNNAVYPPLVDSHIQYFQNNVQRPATGEVASLLQTNNLGSTDSLAAAQQVILNITQPFPGPISPSLGTQLQGLSGTANPETHLPALTLPQQVELVDRLVEQSVYSAAQQPLYQMMANRLPIPNDPNQRSLIDILEQESSWRAQSPQWLADLSVTPKEGILRELAQMEAIRLWLQYQQYRQNEEIQMLLSTLLSTQNHLNAFIQKSLQDSETMKQQNAGG